MVEREKFDHIEERLRVIERGRNYAFADMAKLCLVPDIVIPPKFKVSDFDKYKGTTCPQESPEDVQQQNGGILKKRKIVDAFLPGKCYWGSRHLVY